MGNEQGKSKKLEILKKAVDPELEKEIVKIAQKAAKECETDKEKAEYMKLELDDKYQGPWNVIVGLKFGGNITHIPDHFIYFIINGIYHLVYSTRKMTAASARTTRDRGAGYTDATYYQ